MPTGYTWHLESRVSKAILLSEANEFAPINLFQAFRVLGLTSVVPSEVILLSWNEKSRSRNAYALCMVIHARAITNEEDNRLGAIVRHPKDPIELRRAQVVLSNAQCTQPYISRLVS